MNDKQRLMIEGMDKLLRRFNKYPNDKEFTVEEIIKASNEVYDEILKSGWHIEILRRKKMKIFDYADLGGKRSWDYSINGLTPEDDGIKPIIEIDKEINIGDTLIISNAAYAITCLSGKRGQYYAAYVEKLKLQKVFIDGEEPEDKDCTEQITCPYCGYENGDSWEADDDEDECECPCCGSVFSYQRDVTVEYCSQPVRKAEVVYLN